MLLSMGIIEDGLGREATFKNYTNNENSFVLERCELYCGDAAFISGVVYLARGDKLPDDILIQNGTALISVGMPPEIYRKPPLQLLVFDDGQELSRLMNETNRIFFEYNTLEQRLQDCVNKGRSVQYMVDLMAPYFYGNELQVGGANFKLLGRSNKIVHLYEISGTSQPDNEGLIAPEILTFFKNDINFSRIRDLTEPFIYGPSIFTCRLMCMNVFHRGEYVCRAIICEDNHPFRGYEEGLIRFFTAFLQLIYDLSTDGIENLPRSLITDVLTDLLNSNRVDIGQMENAFLQRKWHLTGPFLCAKIQLSERDFYNRTTQYYCQQYNRENPGCCFLEFEQTIVAVVNLEYYENSFDCFVSSFIVTFRDNNFRIGYSNVFNSMTHLQAYYTQAKIALRTGQVQNPSTWFYRFTDIELHYLRSKITEELEEEYLCTPEILLLYRYDKENGSDYLHTLKSYIDSHLNAVKAAGELYIHRATMIYRLDRIKESQDLT